MSAPQELSQASDGDAPRKGPKGALLIGALLGSLVLGGVAGVFALGPMVARASGYDLAALSGGDDADAHGAEDEGNGKATNEPPAASLHLIDNLILNPAGSGGARFLMLSAALELGDAAGIELLKARDAESRDIILRVLGARSVEELSEMSNREGLKKELADSLSVLFPRDRKQKGVRRVYFPQFVIQ